MSHKSSGHLQDLRTPVHLIFDPDVTWTAARCKRLLRPIITSLDALQKYPAAPTAKSTGLEGDIRTKDDSGSYTPSGFVSSIRPRHCVDENFDGQSIARPSKRNKRTYSNRRNTSAYDKATKANGKVPWILDGLHLDIPPSLCERYAIGWQPQRRRPFFVLPTVRDVGGQLQHSRPVVVLSTQPDDLTWKELDSKDQIPSIYTEYLRHCAAMSIESVLADQPKEHVHLIEVIYMAIVLIINATCSEEHATHSGTRSLFSTCLRRVPESVAEENSQLSDEILGTGEDDYLTIYEDLEQHFSSGATGWHPMRKVVRSHGVQLVADGVKKRLIPLRIGAEMVLFLAKNLMVDEAESLLLDLVNAVGSQGLYSQWQNHRHHDSGFLSEKKSVGLILTTLQKFALSTNRYGFIYKCLTHLLDAHAETSSWLCDSSKKPFWENVIQSIATFDPSHGPAADLVRAIVSISYAEDLSIVSENIASLRLHRNQALRAHSSLRSRQKREKINSKHSPLSPLREVHNKGRSIISIRNIACNLLVVLSSISEVQRDGGGSLANGKLIVEVIQQIYQDACQALSLASKDEFSGFKRKISQEVLLPLLAVQMTVRPATRQSSRFPNPDLVHYTNFLSSMQDRRGLGSSFVCNVAECCARATSIESFTYVQNLVQCLADDLRAQDEVIPRHLLTDVVVSTAFAFATGSNKPQHLEWAIDVEKRTRDEFGGGHRGNGETKPSTSSELAHDRIGYRWEDGIGEWIATAPKDLPDDTDPHVTFSHTGVKSGIPETESSHEKMSPIPGDTAIMETASSMRSIDKIKIAEAENHLPYRRQESRRPQNSSRTVGRGAPCGGTDTANCDDGQEDVVNDVDELSGPGLSELREQTVSRKASRLPALNSRGTRTNDESPTEEEQSPGSGTKRFRKDACGQRQPGISSGTALSFKMQPKDASDSEDELSMEQ